MEIPQLKEIKMNKKFLLEKFGYDSIYDAKKDFNKNAEFIYKHLFNSYNNLVNNTNAINKKIEIENKIQQEKEEQEQAEKEEQEAKMIERIKKSIRKNSIRLKKGKISEFDINLFDIFDNSAMTFDELVKALLDNIRKYLYDANVLIESGGVSYVVNDMTIQHLEKWLTDSHFDIGEDHTESDGMIIGSMRVSEKITIKLMPKAHKNKKANGAFFQYTHNTLFDLSRYGVYNEIQKEENTCLLQALLNGGLDASVIEELKCYVKNRRIPKSDFEAICNIAKIRINLKNIDDAKNRDICKNIFGKKNTFVFDIGLIE